MKFRNTGGTNDKIEPQMAPMIDIVFQLLIFFMLTLKIIEPEGDFTVNMPQGRPQQTPDTEVFIEPKNVVMTAKADGTLEKLQFGGLAFSIRPVTDTAKIDQYITRNPKMALSRQQAAVWMGEDAAFKQMTDAVEKWVRQQRQFFASGSKADKEKFEKELKIKMSFTYHLHNRYIIKATGACRDKLASDGRAIDLVKNIEFIRPQKAE